eukprot:gene2179-10418_t
MVDLMARQRVAEAALVTQHADAGAPQLRVTATAGPAAAEREAALPCAPTTDPAPCRCIYLYGIMSLCAARPAVVDAGALRDAGANAALNGAASRSTVSQGDLFGAYDPALKGTFDGRPAGHFFPLVEKELGWLARGAGVDIFTPSADKGKGSLRAAVDWLLPYALGRAPFPYPKDVTPFDHGKLFQ